MCIDTQVTAAQRNYFVDLFKQNVSYSWNTAKAPFSTALRKHHILKFPFIKRTSLCGSVYGLGGATLGVAQV